MHSLICITACVFITITCYLCVYATGALILPYLCHTLVLIYWHKLVTHAMDQKDRNSQLSVIDLIPFGPILTTHHGSQDKWRHIEGIALLQELFFFSALTSKSSSERSDKKRGSVTDDSHGKQFYHKTVTCSTHMPCHAQRSQLFPLLYKYRSYLRKLQARQGERQ